MPPPKDAALSARVLSVIISVPALWRPPPWLPVRLDGTRPPRRVSPLRVRVPRNTTATSRNAGARIGKTNGIFAPAPCERTPPEPPPPPASSHPSPRILPRSQGGAAVPRAESARG